MVLSFPRVIVAMLCLAPTLAAGAAPTHPATTQASPEEQKKLERIALEAEVAGLPFRKYPSIQAALRLTRQGDRVAVWSTVNNDFDDTARLLVPGMRGVLTLRWFGGPPPADSDEPRSFMFIQRDYTQPGALILTTSVSVAAGRVQIVHNIEDGDASSDVQLLQDAPAEPGVTDPAEPPVRLYIKVHDADPATNDVTLNLTAQTFTQLCLDHPREIDQYVRPIVRELKQEAAVFAPDPKAAWQVFAADAALDPATIEKVNALARQLDAEEYRTRESAVSQLTELGQPAALVLMRMDRKAMSPEKRSSIDTILAAYLPLADEQAKKLRENKSFLLDCLSLDDATLRSLAWKQLQSVAHPSVQYDPNASEADRSAAAAMMREGTR